MSQWKYADTTNQIVVRTDQSGRMESCHVSALSDEEISGILPADPMPAHELNAPILAQLAALDLKLIRPLSEGDQIRITDIQAQKVALRSQLKK